MFSQLLTRSSLGREPTFASRLSARLRTQLPNQTAILFNPWSLAALSGLGWLFMTATFGCGAATGMAPSPIGTPAERDPPA